MEAVPKLPLISFELKVSPENTHFAPKLKQYIAEAYREDPESYSNEIHQLEGLRSAAVRPSLDAAGLSSLIRYFCQLRALQSRFPMSKGQPVACSFAWKDLYANMSSSLADIRFEMACILYNIGALYTQLAASEPRTSADSLKAACTKYQNAAWAFLFLREQYTQPSGVDVSSEIMRLLQEICFAQAQECILDKSIQDTKKPSVVGAVAVQVLHFYKNSLALLGPSTGTDNIHEIIGTKLYNYWHRYLSFKAGYIGCIVCLYQGMNAEEQQKMGERVAYYQQAADKLGEARKLAKYIEPTQITQEALTFTNDVVEGKKKAAKNENEFIYHEEVPDKDLLMDLKPACLVKAIPINLNDPEISGPDIFSRLVPMVAHEAASMYSEEKAKLLRHVVAQVDAKNTELTEFMSSLQLDQLDVLDSDQKIPQEIVDRCAAMNAKTEIIQTLVDSMNNLAEIISDVEHSLAEIKSLIQDETAKEKEFQKVMGPRPPSIVQTELSREFHKYQEAHARTTESNQVLHKAMTLHIANLRLLSQPLDVLQSKIPSIDNIEGLDRETMAAMRVVVGKAREMQTQRDSLVQQLRAAVTADDVTPKLLARGNEPASEIFKQELEKHTPLVKIIEQNLAAQENIINKLTSLYASYGDSRRLLSDVLRKRDGLINALLTSYDTHLELLGKSQKGQEFYRRLASSVAALGARLRSTRQVQAEERAQLLATSDSHAQRGTTAPRGNTASTPTSTAAPKPTVSLDSVPPPSGGGRKLKDYLPYMKNRNAARSVTPQAQIDPTVSDSYYPETIYPTSVRPTPVGSEATDVSQMKIPDGVVMPPNMQTPNPYARYGSPYAQPEPDPYAAPANYGYPAKPYDKPDDASYGAYSAPYTPPQYSSHAADPQPYAAQPYYAAPQSTAADAQLPYAAAQPATPSTSQYNPYADPYAPAPPDPSSSAASYQTDMNVNFAQMHISFPKPEAAAYGADYSQTFYSVQYPHAASPGVSTYSHAPQNSATCVTPSQTPSDNSALNYPYTGDQYAPQPAAQSYPMYGGPGAAAPAAPAAAAPEPAAASQYAYPADRDPAYAGTPNMAQLDAYDQPIKSHVTGQALSSNVSFQSGYQTYDPNSGQGYVNPVDQTYQTGQTGVQNPHPGYANPTNQTYQPTDQTYQPTDQTYQPTDQTYQPTDQNASTAYATQNQAVPQNSVQSFNNPPDQSYQVTNQTPAAGYTNQAANGYAYPTETSSAYGQTFQNHPGYTYNANTGNYDYAYGSQNSYMNYTTIGQSNMEQSKQQNWGGQQYTTAGSCETVQSPSEGQAGPAGAGAQYYSAPYGYQAAGTEAPPAANYADINQSTYMQSGPAQDTSVTYSGNQVSTPKEEIPEPSFNQSVPVDNQTTYTPAEPVTSQGVQGPTSMSGQTVAPQSQEVKKPNVKIEEKPEPSVFDLLSDIDFSVEQKPLMPDIKVPQISESAIKKQVFMPKEEPVPKPVVPKEEVIERPAKMDLFSDPMLLNNFTQEVKQLHRIVDSYTSSRSTKEALETRWKALQDEQVQNIMYKSKSVALEHGEGNDPADVVPFDESRLTLKSDPDAYINASYYKRLASWCIPLVISNNPDDDKYGIFWKAVLENKISCVVCLQSEIEMQGKSYWPTAKGQCLELPGDLKVTLDDVKCTVHWTERKLTVACGKTVAYVSHYQINVYPSKIVCPPLVLLADKILYQTYESRLSNQLSGAWVACASGGRCAVLALLVMLLCQVRAGQLDLCDMLEAGCVNLYKHRTNILEDKKYLVDAYITALFYVQGVLCSGTTMFNGETVSVLSAPVLPPVTPNPTVPTTQPTTQSKSHKHRFSRESFEEMKQTPGLATADMKDPLNFLDPLWSLKKK